MRRFLLVALAVVGVMFSTYLFVPKHNHDFENCQNLSREYVLQHEVVNSTVGREREIAWLHEKISLDLHLAFYKRLPENQRSQIVPQFSWANDFFPNLKIYKEKDFEHWRQEYMAGLKRRGVLK